MSETITHAIADDCEADDYSEAKELFELTVVTVSVIQFRGFTHVTFASTSKFNTLLMGRLTWMQTIGLVLFF